MFPSGCGARGLSLARVVSNLVARRLEIPPQRPARVACTEVGARGRALLTVAVVVLSLLACSAEAAPPWFEHYNRGLELEAQGAWGRALEAFGAAAKAMSFPQRRMVTPRREVIEEYDPHYHMALCLAELHRPKLAEKQLKIAQEANVTPHEKLVELWARIQTEEAERGKPAATPTPTTGQLKVDSDPPGAHVLVDGVEQGVTPLGPVNLPPGERLVRVEATRFRPAEEHVTIRAGEVETLFVPLASQSAAPAATPRPIAVGPGHPSVRAAKPALQLAPAPLPPTAGIPTAAPPAPGPARTEPQPAPQARAAGTATPAVALALATNKRAGGSSLPYVAVALAIVAAIGSALWLRGRRRPLPEVPTQPTAVLEQAPTLAEAGTKLGSYTLEGILGRGGMATTYRAKRASDGRTVALKVPHEGCLADQTFVARFLREGQLGEQLHHPGIVRIHDSGEANGRPYLAMELIAGNTLKRELREGGAMPLRRALEIARDIAEALDYAHAKGVVHRDLKPENVMFLADGALKVMDFGIARLTDQPGLTTSNLFLGTPLYAAPEMVDPKHIDHRVDLYALGIILYEMLEGTVPFTADSPYRVLEMHMHQPLPAREELPRAVPEPVWRVVTRLCEKDPAARYPSAAPLLVELSRLLQRLDEIEGAPAT
ncbi:MAG: protein kinase [Thermoanaerobaculales bacterium]